MSTRDPRRGAPPAPCPQCGGLTALLMFSRGRMVHVDGDKAGELACDEPDDAHLDALVAHARAERVANVVKSSRRVTQDNRKRGAT